MRPMSTAVQTNQVIIDELRQIVGSDGILTGDQLISRYVHIWKMDQSLSAIAVVLPRSTQEVSAILKACHTNDQKVSIHGGLTGLTGARSRLIARKTK